MVEDLDISMFRCEHRKSKSFFGEIFVAVGVKLIVFRLPSLVIADTSVLGPTGMAYLGWPLWSAITQTARPSSESKKLHRWHSISSIHRIEISEMSRAGAITAIGTQPGVHQHSLSTRSRSIASPWQVTVTSVPLVPGALYVSSTHCVVALRDTYHLSGTFPPRL
jgi:hypothetical protein